MEYFVGILLNGQLVVIEEVVCLTRRDSVEGLVYINVIRQPVVQITHPEYNVMVVDRIGL